MENTTKIHKHLVLATLDCLKQSFVDGFYIDKVLEKSFKANKKWGARDRRFIAESSYEILRWWRKLWHIHGNEPSFDNQSLLEIFSIWLLCKDIQIPSWHEFEDFPFSLWRQRAKESTASLGVSQSLPDWMAEKFINELGASEALEALKVMNTQADVVLRVNTLKLTKEKLKVCLEKEGISTRVVDKYPDALVLSERSNVFRTNAFKMGYFEVQDAASQKIAPLLDIQPGMRVIDACAGAGGKSLHIASLLENKGKLIALDIHGYKLDQLKLRARRNGVSVIESREIQGAKTIKRLQESADRVLLDVPCSGLGVLRRNPDTKWKLSPERIDELKTIQKEILASYSRMTKVGGKMVYATCSVLKEENEEQVAGFLEQNPNWQLLQEERMWPHRDGFDGFYAAVLVRNS